MKDTVDCNDEQGRTCDEADGKTNTCQKIFTQFVR